MKAVPKNCPRKCFDAKTCMNTMVALLQINETLFLSINVSDTHFPPPPMMSKWSGLRAWVYSKLSAYVAVAASVLRELAIDAGLVALTYRRNPLNAGTRSIQDRVLAQKKSMPQ